MYISPSEYREFRDAADVFAACCPKAKHFDGDCAAANRLYPILEKIRERAVSAADDPRDAEIARLSAALSRIRSTTRQFVDARYKSDLKHAIKSIAEVAAQALAEPGEKP